MTAFRILLVVLWTALVVYTGGVIMNHGWGLFQVFFGDMIALTWPGQFNLDFTCMLALSATWLAWRHQFSPAGLVIAIVGFFGGFGFLGAYLLVASVQVNGDAKALLLGKLRAAS